MVEEAVTVDLLDAHTRVTKTNYRLGWPSSPRDVVTISKTLVDQYTLVDISTSLPRSKHEPAYLRPAPPYVRAHVSLLAWCVQLPNSSSDVPDGKARITCFWSWNPKGTWAVGGGVPQHLPSVMVGLVDFIRDGSERVPILSSYGPDVSVGSTGYDVGRDTLSVGYAIVKTGLTGENEGLRRQVEFGLSSTQSWDVQIGVRTQSGEESPSTLWTSFVGQAPAVGRVKPARLVLRFAHAQLEESEELVRVNVSIERTSSSYPGVRINGIPVTIEPMGPAPRRRPLLDETASASGISLRTLSTMETMSTTNGSVDTQREPGRSFTAEKSIASMIRRNYIYFTSLLQEPEGKWRPVLDSRGVAIHQLDSIDKTLIVFRAEAVFVGVSIWDLFATIASPSGRIAWDKSHDESVLLEDVNELTDLWHFKSKAAWPTSARDSVMLRTTYKSPSSVHVFGFSVDNTDLFPRIPPSIDPTIIRTQIDLQGWSIESLSPNTTQVTLLEQSDPRGWSNKSSIPQVMMSTLAGIGEFAIKHGSPPVATRLGGARALASRYDPEKETFRFEYEAADARRSHSSSTSTAFPLPIAVRSGDGQGSDASSLRSLPGPRPVSNLECELRCDADKWANAFTVVIDPPHTAISVLKRHRLSHEGGGLWLTIEHDPATLGKDKVVVTVRKGVAVPGSKTTVMVNGSKVKVDVEDLKEADVRLLQSQKRAPPTRAPLDQPPALGTLRKKQSQMDIHVTPADPFKTVTPSAYSRLAMPLTRWYSAAAETTKAAIVPMTAPSPVPLPGTTPVDAAVKALGQLSRMHADRDGESTDPHGWQPVSDRDGLKIEKRIVSHVSETFPVYRAGRILEGFTAEEVSASISSLSKDDRFDRRVRLQSYGPNITTSHTTAHTTFPFRGRSVLLASIVARQPDGPPPSPSVSVHHAVSTILHASTSSFDSSALAFDATKYNPANLPPGTVILEGWILETIDPYSHEQYAIPSTRCMYVSSVDYSGSMPLSVNNVLNSSLPRVLLTVEAGLKANGPPSRARNPAGMILAPDATVSSPWAIEGADGERIGVDVRNDESNFDMSVIVQPTTKEQDSLSPMSPVLKHTDSKLSVTSSRSTVIDLAEDIRKGRKDLLVAEIDVGAALAKGGCEVKISGVSLPASRITRGGETFLPLSLPLDVLALPFKVSVIALSPSLLQSASLDPTSTTRHLLRVTLPTSGYEPSIDDPLSSRTPPLPRPRWLLDLLNDGAVVKVSLRPKETKGYIYAGQEISVEDEKPGRGPAHGKGLPRLVSRARGEALRPLAVATEYLPELPPVEVAAPESNGDAGSVTDSPQVAEKPVSGKSVSRS